MQFQIGLNSISNYKRLSYSPWHAIAEFVDNSTQSYFDNREVLDDLREDIDTTPLTVEIDYKRKRDGFSGSLVITDNAMGMSSDELDRAMHVALPPVNTSGRSKYGMGLKTAASWMGNSWSIVTKKLGETVEYSVYVDVHAVAAGTSELLLEEKTDRPMEDHYTVLSIEDHNRKFYGRAISSIKQHLGSMYREDFRSNLLTLCWGDERIEWDLDDEDQFLRAAGSGEIYRKPFEIQIETEEGETRNANGWVGILKSGSRSKAGFSVLCASRVITGYPDSWRPWRLYGQIQGSNDLVNQRLFGEIHLDDFEVSHTKDKIIWSGDEESLLNEALWKECSDYRGIAQQYRKPAQDYRGPSTSEVDTAISEMKAELMSDRLRLWALTDPQLYDGLITMPKETYVNSVVNTIPATFRVEIAEDLLVRGFVSEDMSPYAPYLAIDYPSKGKVEVIVNMSHPHWKQLKGSDGVLNYLRHCVYDGLAEYRAQQQKTQSVTILPDTIKFIKDKLLRIPFEIERDAQEESVASFADEDNAGE